MPSVVVFAVRFGAASKARQFGVDLSAFFVAHAQIAVAPDFQPGDVLRTLGGCLIAHAWLLRESGVVSGRAALRESQRGQDFSHPTRTSA